MWKKIIFFILIFFCTTAFSNENYYLMLKKSENLTRWKYAHVIFHSQHFDYILNKWWQFLEALLNCCIWKIGNFWNVQNQNYEQWWNDEITWKLKILDFAQRTAQNEERQKSALHKTCQKLSRRLKTVDHCGAVLLFELNSVTYAFRSTSHDSWSRKRPLSCLAQRMIRRAAESVCQAFQLKE